MNDIRLVDTTPLRRLSGDLADELRRSVDELAAATDARAEESYRQDLAEYRRRSDELVTPEGQRRAAEYARDRGIDIFAAMEELSGPLPPRPQPLREQVRRAQAERTGEGYVYGRDF